MSDDDPSGGNGLEDRTSQQNSNLQLLIDTIGGILTASGELLARLHQLLGGRHSAGEPNDPPPEPDDSTPPDSDCR